MSVRCTYQLSHQSSGIGAEERWYISIDSLILRLDLVVGFLLGMVNATALNVFSTGRPW